MLGLAVSKRSRETGEAEMHKQACVRKLVVAQALTHTPTSSIEAATPMNKNTIGIPPSPWEEKERGW
jgi:hypothetical protein